MITAVRSMDVLIEGVLDNGLAFIGEYLEKIMQRPIMITDHHGKILFPENSAPEADIDSLFIHISFPAGKNEYCYLQEESRLIYCIEANQQNAYIVINHISGECIAGVVAFLRECRLPVKCYFSKLNKNKQRFEKELSEYLFGQRQTNLRDVFHLYDADMDLQRPCLAMLLQIEDQGKTEAADLCIYACEYLKQERIKAFTVCHQDQLACILLLNPEEEHPGEKLSSSNLDLTAFKSVLENKFKISASMGAGRVYALGELEKSFNEARTAIILNQLMGRCGAIQKFSDMGIYQPIFSQDKKDIHEYCSQRLGRLMEHDGKNDGELLPTLRKLLDACVNIKATADRLFIHVNTLYYRINKIEQILDVDLAKMDTRVELYTAIKVWDTLQILNGSQQIRATGQERTLAMQA